MNIRTPTPSTRSARARRATSTRCFPRSRTAGAIARRFVFSITNTVGIFSTGRSRTIGGSRTCARSGPATTRSLDEACHIKANPNLGVSIQREYLADQVSAARNIPGETNTVLRLNFCVWTQQHTRAIDMAAWFECAPPPPDAELVGVPCYGGLDLGMSDDFTAWVRVWTLDDGRVVVKCRFWLPSAALTKYPHRPYAQWQRRGLLTVTEGLTTDYDTVEATVGADCHRDGIRSVAYDKRFAEQLAQHLIGDGVDMIDQPQGFQLTEAIRRKGELVAARTLCHGGDEILAWMAANYVIRHGHPRRHPARQGQGGRQDRRASRARYGPRDLDSTTVERAARVSNDRIWGATMSDKRPRGRPPIDEDDRSVDLSIKIPGKALDTAATRARLERVTLAEWIRRMLREGRDPDPK